MIQVAQINRKVGSFDLKEISFPIRRGDYIVLLGDSGSGKSLLLEILAGLIPPDSGSILLNDCDITNSPIRDRPFGMVFQDLALFPHMTVYDNLAYPLKNRKRSAADIRREVMEIAGRMEIGSVLGRSPGSLSGGEKQRVALARTLITAPECLLLDEPLSSVDARIRKEIKSVLRNLNRDGQTIIHVTHDYQEAMSLASMIGILENGRLVRFGPALEVLRNPESPFMASFTGIRNFIPVRLARDPADGAVKAWTEQNIPLVFQTDKDHGNGYLIIPEEAVLLSREPVSTSAANQMKGRVIDILPSQHGFEVILDVGFSLSSLLTAEGIERVGVKTGDTVYASFKATALRYIRR